MIKPYKVKRIKSGITGLDKLIDGGIPENDLILLSGICGAGKTILGIQYLCSSDDPGIYVSFEEDLPQIRSAAKAFKWDIEKKEKANKLRLLKYDPYRIDDIFEIIESNIKEIKAKRVVIDSISAIGIYVKDKSELRRMILQVSSMLRKHNCTSILISEIPPSQKDSISRFGVEEFVADGVIVLYNKLVSDEYRRGLSVWKLRSTNHSKKIHPYKINNKGFMVYPNDIFAFKGIE